MNNLLTMLCFLPDEFDLNTKRVIVMSFWSSNTISIHVFSIVYNYGRTRIFYDFVNE